ncbi:hypothetical protein [Bradyrhizobium sp. USDA 10063]
MDAYALRERAALGRDYLSCDGAGVMTGDIIACKFNILNPGSVRASSGRCKHVAFWPIVLKKSKMLPRQNSRKSLPAADFL